MREEPFSPFKLSVVLVGNALMRVAGSAGSFLVGVYIAELVRQGRAFDALLVGTLSAVSFGAELVGALPMGALSDAKTPRVLMVGGALLGAVSTQLFNLGNGAIAIFFLSRALEGMAVAATTPSVLAYLTNATDGNEKLRGKAMSFFELSLLGGLAFGGLVAGGLWNWLRGGAFSAVAVLYVLTAILFGVSGGGGKPTSVENVLAGLKSAVADPFLRRLAPAWLCVNAMVGLWLGSTLPFLLTLKERKEQYITGLFADEPDQVGVVFLVYAIVFAVGVTAWSFIIHRFPRTFVMRVTLVALFGACAGLYVLNHSQSFSATARVAVIGATALAVMVESGFTPAALALLADAVGAQTGRGATMGIYSVLLSVAALTGSLLAGFAGKQLAIDGLIFVTVGLAALAFVTVSFLHEPRGLPPRNLSKPL